MGYYTNYKGRIKFNPKNKILVNLLKLITKECNKSEYLSSSQNGQTKNWFYPEDEWILFSPLGIQVIIDFKEGTIKFKEEDTFKAYEYTIENLCLLIALLDKTAEGELDWIGEDMIDVGIIKLNNGKVLLGDYGDNYKNQIVNNLNDETDTYIRPKFDIFGFIKILPKNCSYPKFKQLWKSHLTLNAI